MSSPNENFEREFEAFMNEEDSRLAALYRKLPQDEPDARLDAAVRSMAHRALNPQLVATPRADSRRPRLRWIPALGTAAGLVLAAGVAWRMGPSLNQRNETGAPASDVISVRPLDAPVPTAPPLSPAPPPATAIMSAPGAAGAPAAKAVSAPPPSVQEQAKTGMRDQAAEPPQQAENQPTDAGALGKVESSAAKPAAPPQAFPEAAKTAPAKQKRASEMDAVERRQTMAAGAWQNLHDRDEQAGGKDAKLEDKARNLAAPAAGSPAAAPMSGQPEVRSTVAPQPAGPTPRGKAAALPASAPSPPALQSAPAAPTAERALATPEAPRVESGAARTDAMPSAAPSAQRLRSTDPNAELYPEHWLANIRTMLGQNRRDEALRSLAEFRRIYPDYRLPDDLRDLK